MEQDQILRGILKFLDANPIVEQNSEHMRELRKGIHEARVTIAEPPPGRCYKCKDRVASMTRSRRLIWPVYCPTCGIKSPQAP